MDRGRFEFALVVMRIYWEGLKEGKGGEEPFDGADS